MGDQIRHGSSGWFWVTLRWGWGRAVSSQPHTPAGLRADLSALQELSFPHCRDPFPTSFTGPLSSQPPPDAGNQVKEEKWGWGGDWLCLPSPVPSSRLPVHCPCPLCSSEPAEAEKEKAGTGPAQTSGCRDLRLWSRAGGCPCPWLGKGGLRLMWLGAREPSLGGSLPPHSLMPVSTHVPMGG